MRTPLFVRTLALLIATISPTFVCAQFQESTPEELKMTADPKAPGAAAVYLNVEETTNDPLHLSTFYARIKVLTEKGKELATVEVPYLHGEWNVFDIKARTIHPDGTIIPLVGKPEDLLSFKKTITGKEHLQVNLRVFNLPSVEVGSILEYRYDVRHGDHEFPAPTWEIQRPYFVHKAHYFFTPFTGFLAGTQGQISSYLLDEHSRTLNTLIWWPNLPPGASVKPDASGRYSVDLTDIPPAPNEEWMPPIQSSLYKVIFYYKAALSSTEFWDSEDKLWSKDVEHFAEPSKAIKDAVIGLIAPGDSDMDKAKKLYKSVETLDNTNFSRKKSKSELMQLKLKNVKHADDILAQKSGDREEIAMLYLAMLRATGLTAYAVKVVDREKGIFDPTYLTLRQLDDTLVLLSTGGKEIFLDPGEKMCPFQTVSWRHSDAGGIRQMEKGAAPLKTPSQAYPENKTVRMGDITLDGHGGLTASFRFSMTGQEALRWRQKSLTNDLDEVKKQFDKWLESIFPEGVEAHIDSFSGLDDPDKNLLAVINAKGNLGSATSKRLMLPAFFFATRGSHPFVAVDKRQQPVDMHYGDLIIDQVTYHLPAGFSVEGAPKDTKISWPQHAIFNTKSAAAAGQITIVRSLGRAFTLAEPGEYGDLRGFYQKVAAADEEQLVLTTVPVAAPAPAPTPAPAAAKGN